MTKLERFYRKVVTNNIKRFTFTPYFYLSTIIKKHYQQHVEKIKRKQFIVKYPVLAFLKLDDNGANLPIYLGSKGGIEDAIFRTGKWETTILELAQCFIKPNSIIIDVGANIGAYSLYWAKKYPNCHVHAYEPSSHVFACLKKSRELNQLSNLFLYNAAVGSKCGIITINAATKKTENKGASSIHNHHENIIKDDTFIKEEVEVIPLNHHLNKERKVSFIKIDVQGYEKEVLAGAWSLIKKDKPAIIFEHEDPGLLDPIATREYIACQFDSLDYEIFFIESDCKRFGYKFFKPCVFDKPPFVDGDYLAVPKNSTILP